MGGLRFSIASLLIALAVIGGGLAALRAESPTLAGLLTLAVIGVILAAVLGTVCRAERSRCFWLGVALFGSAYFAVAFTSKVPIAKTKIESPLKAYAEWSWSSVAPPKEMPNLQAQTGRGGRPASPATIARQRWDYAFGTTLHCVVNLLFAMLGGLIGWLLWRPTVRLNQ
jgi:hypothetical protein